MRKFIILYLAITLFAAGCAGSGRLKSYTADSFPISSNSGLVGDIADRIASAYPPGLTEVYLTGKGDFALALEDGLRNRGYTLRPDNGDGALVVAWTLDRLDEESWYLLVNLSDGYRFGRVYQDDGLSVEPMGGLSQGIF